MSIRSDYIPMAPNTALAFILLGGAVWVLALHPPRPGLRGWARASAGLVALVVILRLWEGVTDLDLGIDRWIFRSSQESLGLAPVGKMAFQTALAFCCASIALLMLVAPERTQFAGGVAGVLAIMAATVGLIFSLGYAYGAPFSYESGIPHALTMAFTTALGFLVLGVGLVATAGPEVWPLRPLSGPSVYARLFRAFLPFTILTVFVVGWLTHTVQSQVGASLAALCSAFLAVAAIFIGSFVCGHIARNVGGELDRAEAILADQAARMEAILNSTADGIITIDDRRRVLSVNAAAERLFGYRAADIIGRNAALLIPSLADEEQDAPLGRSLLARGAGASSNERELEGQRQDGVRFPVVLKVTEMNYQGERVFIGTVQDVSARKRAAEELAGAATELLATATQQTEGVQVQAAAVTQTMTSVDQVSKTADQAAQRAKSVGAAVQRTLEIGKVGRKTVEDSMGTMRTLKERVESTAEIMLALTQKTQSIGEIIATVNEITEQTNLLSLNAAIEAARAGESGRGFAVVAGEVKALAEQSKKETSQIRKILSEIQRTTNAAVVSTEEVTKGVVEAMKVTAHAGETIRALADTLEQAAQASSQIVASAVQQASGMDQIHEAMQNLDQVAKQNMAATRQVEQAAQNLNTLGVRLAETRAA